MCEAMEAGIIDKQTYKRMNESDEEALSDFFL